MKVAQENSLAAVACLAVGLVITNVGLPGPSRRRVDAETVALSDSAIQITPVNTLEGRLLERVPGNLNAVSEHDPHFSKPFAASQPFDSIELVHLAKTSDVIRAGVIPDKLLQLVLVISIILGLALWAADHKEMMEDAQNERAIPKCPAEPVALAECDAPARSRSAPAASSDEQVAYSKRRAFSMWTLAPFSLIILCLGAVLRLQSRRLYDSDEVGDAHEFSELAQLAKNSSDPRRACLSDSAFLLVIGIGAAIGAACMRSDHEEMAQESSKASASAPEKHAAIAASPEQDPTPGRRFASVPHALALLLILVSFGIVRCPQSHLGLGSSIQSSTDHELGELAQLVHDSMTPRFTRLCDSVLVLVIGICAAVGAACMRYDHEEMAQESSNPLKSEAVASAPEKQAAIADGPEEYPTPGRRFASVPHACALLLILVCFGIVRCPQSHLGQDSSIQGSTDHELGELAQLVHDSMTPRSTRLSDSVLVLVIGICAAIGAVCMRYDREEMATEVCHSSDVDVASPSPNHDAASVGESEAACMRSDHEEMAQEFSNPSENEAIASAPEKRAEIADGPEEYPTLGRRFASLPHAFALLLILVCFGIVRCPQSHNVCLDSSIQSNIDHELGELAQLVHDSMTPRSTRLCDSVLVVVIGICAAVGAVCARYDREEMAAECHSSDVDAASPPPDHDAASVGQSEARDTAGRHYSSRCLLVGVLLALGLLGVVQCLQSRTGSVDEALAPELKELEQLSHSSPDPCLARLSDGVLLFALGIAVLLGVACMRSDCEEMAKESSTASESYAASSADEYVTSIGETLALQSSGRSCFSYAVVAVCLILGCGGIVLSSQSGAGVGSSVEIVVDREFEELAQLAHTSLNALPEHLHDGVLVLVLGVCAAIGAACMRDDRIEMANEQSNPSEAAADACSPIKVVQFEGEPAGFHSSLKGTVPLVLAILTSVCFGIVLLLQSLPSLQCSGQAADVNELSELVQLANNSLNSCPAYLSDSALVLMLIICAALGAACVRFDCEDMAKESSTHSDMDAIARSPENHTTSLSEPFALETSWLSSFPTHTISAILVSLMCLGTYLCLTSQHGPDNHIEAVSALAFKELAQLAHNSLHLRSASLSDSALALVLGLGATMGAACMIYDHKDLAQHSTEILARSSCCDCNAACFGDANAESLSTCEH